MSERLIGEEGTGPSRPAAMARPEKRVAGVFAPVATLWIASPPIAEPVGPDALPDAGVATSGALPTLVAPANRRQRVLPLDWAWAKRAAGHLAFRGRTGREKALER